jgi:hypothetical protein
LRPTACGDVAEHLQIQTGWRVVWPPPWIRIEAVPDIPMFRKNTAAFVHDLAPGALSNVDGDSNYVRVQVLTNAGALDKQLAVVRQFTHIIAAAEAQRSREHQR